MPLNYIPPLMKKILVPTDYSDAAENAAEYAVYISEAAHKPIIFFHAGFPEKEVNSQVTAFINSETEVLEKPKVRCSSEGFDLEAISELITKNHVKVIIMGTVGLTANKMFGSIAELMVEKAPCPVILVPPNHQYKGIHKIGFASDLVNLESEIGKVISFARIFNSQIEICHVSPLSADIAHLENISMRTNIELIKRLHQYANINYDISEMPPDNDINEGISAFLTAKNIDLLVVFHRNDQPLGKLFSPGSTDKRVKHLKVPVLVHRKE